MRTFQLVPFGSQAPPGSICCDGLVEGALLDLSHWPGNHTQAKYKADTSTESALRFAGEGIATDALVVNNHFDVDGVLTVFALLHPAVALAHRDVMIAAAEVGDFEEWPTVEQGIWLAAAISSLAEGLEEGEAYQRVLAELPDLLPNLMSRESLWSARRKGLEEDLHRANGNGVTVCHVGNIAILSHAEGEKELDAVAAHRLMRRDVTRLLWAFAQGHGAFNYRYELPHYCWADTVKRPKLARPDKQTLSAALKGSWSVESTGLGMTGLAKTLAPLAIAPPELARQLVD